MVRILEIQQFSDNLKTIPGTFCTISSRYEVSGIFVQTESAPCFQATVGCILKTVTIIELKHNL